MLTDIGRSTDISNYPNDEQTQAVTAYWDKKNALRYEKYKAKTN